LLNVYSNDKTYSERNVISVHTYTKFYFWFLLFNCFVLQSYILVFMYNTCNYFRKGKILVRVNTESRKQYRNF